MHIRPSPIIPTLLLLVTVVHSHKPGQEYTYLSMFSKPQTEDMIEGDNHLGQLYEQLSVHKNHHRRRQLSRFVRPTKLKLYQFHQKDQSRHSEPPDLSNSHQYQDSKTRRMERISLPDDTDLSVRVLDKQEDDDDDEDEDGDEEDDDDTNLQREHIPGGASNVHLANADADDNKENTSNDKDLADQMAHKYGENLERIQTMLLKIIRTYNIQSMVDVPCRAHAHWMPLFLETLSAEREKFKYYCVDTSKEVLKSVKESVTEPKSSRFILRRFWQEALPKADLVFSWAGLDNMQPENVAKYFGRLSKTGENHKMVAVGTHNGELKKRGTNTLIARFTAGGMPINVREAPFMLKKPLRVIGDLSTQGNDKKMYLYKPDDML